MQMHPTHPTASRGPDAPDDLAVFWLDLQLGSYRGEWLALVLLFVVALAQTFAVLRSITRVEGTGNVWPTLGHVAHLLARCPARAEEGNLLGPTFIPEA